MPSDTTQPPGRRAGKVILKPGFSLMDWTRLCKSTVDLGGRNRFGGSRSYTMNEVAEHRTVHDAWGVIRGKVYNLSPYLEYHPGGADILVEHAGKDCTALFNSYHPWVNIDGLAEKLVMGRIVEDSPQTSAILDDGAIKQGGTSIAINPEKGLSAGKFESMGPPPPRKRMSIPGLMGKEDE